MGNTAAISSGNCCCENEAQVPQFPLSADIVLVATQKNYKNEFDSCRSRSVASLTSESQGFTEVHLEQLPANQDRFGQPPNSSSLSVPMSLNQYRRYDFITNGRLNKGSSFTIEERQKLGILGLLPPAVKSVDQEMARCKANLDRLKDVLDKHIYLVHLQETNEKLFYRLIWSNVAEYMPLVYTPVVGLACQKFSLIYQKPPRGLYVTIHDKGHVYEVLCNWPETDVRAIVVTDGERILGLGDLGANGMGIPCGKLSLYTALAGVKPNQCLPVTLDVGTETEGILKDPFYLGLRQRRVRGHEYDDFVDEFMHACVKRFGANVLIQFEDFGNQNAFRFLEKYRLTFCVFNDDIQGTAAVAVAGLLASLKLNKTRLSDHVILFQGAGEASLGIALLCVMAMTREGTSEQNAKDKIWMVDSKGLIVKDRPEGNVSGHKAIFAKDHAPVRELSAAVKKIKPSILIGASAVRGAFTPEILRDVASFHKQPVVFALSNPTDKAECTALEAYTHTNGNVIFASGSPFDPVVVNGKRYEPGQGNNSYIFPGIALAVVCAGVKYISEELFLLSALTLADLVQDRDLEVGRLYPPLQEIQMCSMKIAAALIRCAYKSGVATTFPEPRNIEEFIKRQMYSTEYENCTPTVYSYP